MGTEGRFVFKAFVCSLVCIVKFPRTLPLHKEKREA